MKKVGKNIIAEHLDRLYVEPGDHITMERNAYNAALEALTVAGFIIDCVPIGSQMIHIVK